LYLFFSKISDLQFNDDYFTLILISVFLIYVILIFKRYFLIKYSISIIKSLLFVVLFLLMLVIIYRPLVFFVTYIFI
jgi:hypothetical protein